MKDVCPEEATAICYVSMDTAPCAAKLDSTVAPDIPQKADTFCTRTVPQSTTLWADISEIDHEVDSGLYVQFLSPAVHVTAVIYSQPFGAGILHLNFSTPCR